MKCQTKRVITDAFYIFRGFIAYYGRHYTAYFYSHKIDKWVKMDDSKLTIIGDFNDVQEKCVSGKTVPTICFYECATVIQNIVGTDNLYYLPQNHIAFNNFWKRQQVDKKNQAVLETQLVAAVQKMENRKPNDDCSIF